MLWMFSLGCHREPTTSAEIPTPTPTQTTREPLRNVLMLSIDTLRRDHVDRYATDGIVRMPFLSSLMAQGVALDDHQQCSNWTYHSVTCTLLGRPVEALGWIPKLCGDGATPVPDGQRTLAVRLAEAGFHTGLVSTNRWLSSDWNSTQGYEEQIGASSQEALAMTERALEQFGARLLPGERWLLHLHYLEPHAPYSPPEAYRAELDALPPIAFDLDDYDAHYEADDAWQDMPPEERDLLERHLRARYDGELRWLDDQLAAIFERLEQDGWLEQTLVVIWSDHGEQFWEHGQQTHAWGLAAEESDGILSLWARDLEPLAWSGPTHSVDLIPTVLDAVGLDLPDDDGLTGAVVGTAPPDRSRFASTCARGGAQVGITREQWKLVYGFDGSLSLWDRAADRAGLPPLSPSEWDATLVRSLWSELEPIAEQLQIAAPEIERIGPVLP